MKKTVRQGASPRQAGHGADRRSTEPMPEPQLAELFARGLRAWLSRPFVRYAGRRRPLGRLVFGMQNQHR